MKSLVILLIENSNAAGWFSIRTFFVSSTTKSCVMYLVGLVGPKFFFFVPACCIAGACFTCYTTLILSSLFEISYKYLKEFGF